MEAKPLLADPKPTAPDNEYINAMMFSVNQNDTLFKMLTGVRM
jgi:hypothetical protein